MMEHLREMWRKLAAPRRSGPPGGYTWQSWYRETAPKLVVSVYSGGYLKEVLAEVDVPWEGDLLSIIGKLTREAKEKWENRPSGGVNFADPKFLLRYRGSNYSGVIGAAVKLGADWGTPGPYPRDGYGDDDPRLRQAIFSGSKTQAWEGWLHYAANMIVPGEDTHGVSDSEEIITVYRGMGLPPRADPLSGREDDDRKGAMGYSWTVSLDIAKAIAERGSAGFNSKNMPGGEYYYDQPNPDRNKIPTVLRATVKLGDNATLFEGGIGGWKYLQGEQEVEIPQGTEFTLTGWMQATPLDVPGSTDATGRPARYVTFRWDGFKTVKLKKRAGLEEFPMEALIDEIIEANDEYGFSDYAIENINDRMRDAGIGKTERSQLIEAAHIEATRRMAGR